MTRSPLNSLHGSAQFPERRRGAMPGYSTLDLGRVTHGSGHGVPLGQLAGGFAASGRSFRVLNFSQRKQSARSTPRANADVLKRELVPRVLAREPAKVIAHRVGSTPRTAKAWKNGDHLPQAAHMLMLARAYPEIGAAVRQWLDMHLNEEAAEAERLLRDVQSYLTRRDG